MKKLLLILSLMWPAAAFAEVQGIAAAQVRAGWQASAGHYVAAVDLALRPGWKTYWRSPGDGGIPPLFDWTGSQNLGQLRIIWPRPVVFYSAGLQSIGYHDRLILPLEITAKNKDLPVVLHVKMNLGICKDICVPAEVILTGALAQTPAPDASIQAALADQPMTAMAAKVGNVRCTAVPIKDGMRVEAQIMAPPLGGDEVVVFEHEDPHIWRSESQTRRESGRLTSVVDLVPPDAKPFDLVGDDLTLTILGDGRAATVTGCPLAAAPE